MTFLHGVAGIPVKSILHKIGQKFMKKFRLFRVAKHFVHEREKKSTTLGILQEGGETCRHPHVLLFEQLGSCANVVEANMVCVRKKSWDMHKNMKNVEG